MLKAYIILIDRNLTENEYRRLLRLASPERRERAARLLRFGDRQRSIYGELLARFALSSWLRIRPDRLAFAVGEHGKPEPLGRPEAHFNISHSGRYVVCAAGDESVGIDVQETPEGRNYLRIAERYFHPDELEYLLSFPAGESRASAFTAVWTKKEAYTKFLGLGLALPPSSFCVFSLPDTAFHRILSERGAVCHVCSKSAAAPEVVRFTASEFINEVFRSTAVP
ncbi:MAG: 4'-phosphopantetheinyl transferase superfamily protein [Oscillospiraceae bacterium]|nr:4'-phosphopantetheinyl transferase superfamily protein [Oscillospiraceae bacterium]